MHPSRSWLLFCRFLVFLVLSSGPTHARSILNFPFLTFQKDTITGVAIVNLSDEDAQIQVTAYLSNGQLLQGQGIENPVQLEVEAGTQSGTITVSLFGASPELGQAAWFQAVSETDDLTGFFLYLDTASSFLDGADLPPLSSRLVVSDVRVGAGERTELNLINPSERAATAEVRLVSNQNAESRVVNLAARGAARLDVAELFSQPASPAGILADDPVYLGVESDQELAGFVFVQPATDLLGLNAQPAAEPLNALFFPQLAVLGLFETELTVLSLDEQDPVILTITAYRPDGIPFGPENLQTNPVSRVLEPGGILREDLKEMFGFSGPSTLDGWLSVQSTSQAIQGAISYSIPTLGSIASVASAAAGTRSAVFSHIATTFNFFTGVAILNGGKLVANVEVVAVRQDGTVLGSFRTTLAPGQRLSRTLLEMIPAAADQAGGFILVRSDLPVYLTNVFGNLVSGVLSNVPPQPAPPEFEVETQTEPIKVSPRLAVVPVAGNQQFVVMGPAGPVTWSVNGEPGGGALQGMVDGTGRYTAPAQIPGSLPVVVTARVGEDTAGAATDVLSREVLAGDLGFVQSVAFLSGLQRLYTAELSLGAGPGAPAGLGESSTIFDVTAGLPAQVAQFSGDDVPKMIPFTGSNGKEFLLLAARTTGRVIRLDPQTKQTTTLATGLDEPVALVLDPVNGDLLVAERGGVTRVPAASLDQGLAGAPAGLLRGPQGGVIEAPSPAGVTVDRCTGAVYISDSAGGKIRRADRLSGQSAIVVDGLSNPGQLLGLYRSGISCPESFHLLIAEPGTGRVLLWTARDGLQPWVSSPGIRDLALKVVSEGAVPGSLPANQPGVLLGETPLETGQVALVPVDLYAGQAINPVAGNQLLTGIVEHSSNVTLLSPPPQGVGAEDLTDPDHVRVFLEKVLTLNQDLTPDIGAVIPAGTRIRSYFFHYDPPGTGGVLSPGFVRFDAPILGVINQTATLNDTDGLLGSTATDYSGTVSRVWAASSLDTVQVSDDGGRLDFSASAESEQDQMRVLLPVEVVETPGPNLPGSYQVTTVGQVNSPGQFFEFVDMNNHGEVVFWGPGQFFFAGYIWLNEAKYGLEAGLNEFPVAPGENVFLPTGINDEGVVVGVGDNSPMLWQGSFQSLDEVFSTHPDASPVAISNQGHLTGYADEMVNDDFVSQAFLVDGSFSLLGSPFGPGFDSGGFAVNSSGQVVGGALVPLPQPAGDNGQFVALAWLSGPGSGQVLAENAVAQDINESGQIVYTVYGAGQGVLWENGSTTDLGTLGGSGTQAVGLNNLGQVVGASQTTQEAAHAFLWSDGQMIDLNDRVVSSEVVLIRAIDITDSGIILCQSGSTLYLLTPQEEQ